LPRACGAALFFGAFLILTAAENVCYFRHYAFFLAFAADPKFFLS
jgi:hypothetical protein